MTLTDEIMELIAQKKRRPAPVTFSSNLYTDLGYDSLSFISLLVGLETRYAIEFGLEEMGGCLLAGRLAALIEGKIKEAGHDPTPVAGAQAPAPGAD